MISWWQLVVLTVVYMAVLFALAYWGDQRAAARILRPLRPIIYCLALGIYCTSWTFYGAVGTAAHTGWGYLPIYLGPVLGFVFGFGLIRRIVRITHAEKLTSIADFISFRYGKGRPLAVLVTAVAVIGTVPYLALQLKALSDSFDIVLGYPANRDLGNHTALFFSFVLAAFAIAFGARRLDASEHHRGMMLALAFESMVKLLAFVAVGVAAYIWLRGDEPGAGSAVAPDLFQLDQLPESFITQTLLACAAIFCLPRQFHVMAVQIDRENDLRPARWLFPVYIACFAVFVVPLTYAGLMLLPSGLYAPDTFVLALPMSRDQGLLTGLAFLGGFSAATGMVIVASIALATMVSNEIVVPLLFAGGDLGQQTERDGQHMRRSYRSALLLTRRVTIVLILACAYLYYATVDSKTALASIGLISFSAAAQFAPLIVAGAYWPSANRLGALAGLTVGTLLWFYTLFLPATFGSTAFVQSLLEHGPLGLAWLRPEALFLDLDLNPLTHGVIASLSVNCAMIFIVSRFTRRSLSERISASTFAASSASGGAAPKRGQSIRVGELTQLVERFLGPHQAHRSLEDFARSEGSPLVPGAVADSRLLRFVERLLAGAVGTSSARVILTAALQRSGMGIGDVVTLLDETSQAIRFNRQLLEATLQNMSQGVSVIDASQRIIGWNASYVTLMGYESDYLYIGKPVKELLEFNAKRGHFAGKNPHEEIEKRLALLRAGPEYRFESEFPNGRVVEIHGCPMPEGGYVTTYSDVTKSKAIESALRDSEKRVRGYTDNVPVMICYIDAAGVVRFANKAFAQFAGGSREALIGAPLDQFARVKQLFDVQSARARALSGQRQDYECEQRGADDTLHYFLCSLVPDRSDDGDSLGFFATLQDITVRRTTELALTEAKVTLEKRVTERTHELSDALTHLTRAQQAAEQAHASKTRFFAAAAHDLLQPINAAKLFNQLLQDDRKSLPEAQSKHVERIGSSLDAVEELLNGLLEISQFDAGSHVPRMVDFPLQGLFDDLKMQFAEACRERGLSLTFVTTDAWVRSDRQLLRRILQNFIANAQRYTPEGGISVGARRRNGALALCVYDTGVGIAKENQSRVFDEFQRLSDDRTRGERGIGLGLAIVQRIARLLDHPISMHSVPDRGTRFDVTVPMADAATTLGPADTKSPESFPGAGADSTVVLCIDNDPAILEGMHALLTRWKLTPFTASRLEHLEDTLREITQQHQASPELLIVDYQLDDGDTGLDAVARIESFCGHPIPAIFVTANREQQLRETLVAAGHRVLYKPVKPAALRALIGRVTATA